MGAKYQVIIFIHKSRRLFHGLQVQTTSTWSQNVHGNVNSRRRSLHFNLSVELNSFSCILRPKSGANTKLSSSYINPAVFTCPNLFHLVVKLPWYCPFARRRLHFNIIYLLNSSFEHVARGQNWGQNAKLSSPYINPGVYFTV